MAKLKTLLQKRKALVVIVVVLLVVFFVVKSRSAGNTSAGDTFEVKKGDVEEVLVLSGEVDSTKYATLSFPASGNLSSISVTEGELVTKGQFLAKMDTTELNSAYQRALSDLRAAEATVAKVHDNLKDKGNSESFTEKETRTTAEVAKDKAYELVVQAQKDLRDATLISPISGVVSTVTVAAPGASVTAGATQFEIVDISSLYFSVSADQSELEGIKVGQEVSVVLDAIDEKSLRGVIESIGFTPKRGEAETLYEIKISLKDLQGESVRVGMTGDMSQTKQKATSVLYVEPQYIKTDADGKYLLVGSEKKKVYVETGIEGEDRIEIKSNEIREGDVVHDRS